MKVKRTLALAQRLHSILFSKHKNRIIMADHRLPTLLLYEIYRKALRRLCDVLKHMAQRLHQQ